MDPQAFINTATNSDMPAPMWFVEFFKVLGFTLHSIPMNLWFAGLIIALGLLAIGGEQGRRFGSRFLRQMPIIIAFGVNLGVVPLLFTQLAYFKFFYPATILMAWFWLAIIGLLIPAYYGVYVYVWGLKNNEKIAPWRQAIGWVAAIFFLVIGFIFANAFSLQEHVDRWVGLWNDNQTGGAALGTALNLGDSTLWPRWLMMFGLAQTTTAVWILADLYIFYKKAAEEYKAWAWQFAKKLYTHGMIWASLAGSWYVFLTWSNELRATMFSWPLLVLTVLTAVAPGLPWLMMMTEKRYSAKLWLVLGVILAQVGVMAINGVSRQVVQNLSINRTVEIVSGSEYHILDQTTATQWGPLAMFLVVFVLGLIVLGWMIRQVVKETAEKPNAA
jgi:hypothetical protein